nr:GAF domain-containing protein [Pseudomonas sp.]
MQRRFPPLRGIDGTRDAGFLGRLLAPAVTRPSAVIEVISGMALVFACCRFLRPTDPLLLGIDFPWIWLVATVFALRYGALLGVLAGFCVIADWFVFYGNAGGTSFPIMLFMGGLAQLIIAGHFCDLWVGRLTRLRVLSSHQDERLASITTNHYLLRISHDRLEREILSKPFTLRDALEHVRSLPTSADDKAVLPNADAILQLAASACQIAQASIFAGPADRLGRQPVASVGEPFEIEIEDPLLRQCLDRSSLAHLRQTGDMQSAYLVCAPIMTASGRMMGVLAVRQMSFLALNAENLQLLLVLLNYYAGGVEQRALVAPIQHSLPRCPYDFSLELARLARIRQSSGVGSAMVGLVFPRSSLGDLLVHRLREEHRSPDLLWTYELEHVRVLVV